MDGQDPDLARVRPIKYSNRAKSNNMSVIIRLNVHVHSSQNWNAWWITGKVCWITSLLCNLGKNELPRTIFFRRHCIVFQIFHLWIASFLSTMFPANNPPFIAKCEWWVTHGLFFSIPKHIGFWTRSSFSPIFFQPPAKKSAPSLYFLSIKVFSPHPCYF